MKRIVMPLSAVWIITATAVAVGLVVGSGAAAQPQPPLIVEDFTYPDADRIEQERGITLVRGDGNITLVDCGPTPNTPPADLILVQTNDLTLPGDPNFCFRATGTSGYLAMRLSKVYLIRGESDRTVLATVEVEPVDSADPPTVRSEQVAPGELQTVGITADEGEATLLELRFPING